MEFKHIFFYKNTSIQRVAYELHVILINYHLSRRALLVLPSRTADINC